MGASGWAVGPDMILLNCELALRQERVMSDGGCSAATQRLLRRRRCG